MSRFSALPELKPCYLRIFFAYELGLTHNGESVWTAAFHRCRRTPARGQVDAGADSCREAACAARGRAGGQSLPRPLLSGPGGNGVCDAALVPDGALRAAAAGEGFRRAGGVGLSLRKGQALCLR